MYNKAQLTNSNNLPVYNTITRVIIGAVNIW